MVVYILNKKQNGGRPRRRPIPVIPVIRAPFYQRKKIRARINSSFAYEDRKIQRVVQSARILPIHVKEGDIRGKSTSFYILVSGRPRSR